MNLLSVRGLEVSIAGITVCRGLELDVSARGRWAILGRNGVGKTTLLKTLAGLHAPDAGRIEIDGDPPDRQPRRRLAQRLGVLFQEHTTLFPGTVLETALIGRHPWIEAWRGEGLEDLARARSALDAVDLGGFAQRTLTTLSGGERQRLAIATLLAQDPALCLLDEPTNHLDPYHQIRVMELLCRMAGGEVPRAVVMVLHDVNLAVRFCDHALLLFGDGAAAHGAAREVLNAPNLERLYGHPVNAIRTHYGEYFYPA